MYDDDEMEAIAHTVTPDVVDTSAKHLRATIKNAHKFLKATHKRPKWRKQLAAHRGWDKPKRGE